MCETVCLDECVYACAVIMYYVCMCLFTHCNCNSISVHVIKRVNPRESSPPQVRGCEEDVAAVGRLVAGGQALAPSQIGELPAQGTRWHE